MPQSIAIATEDALSEAVVEKMLNSAPVDFNIVWKRQKRGFGYLKKNIRKFNEVAKQYPVVLLTDLDRAVCASELTSRWLTTPKNPDFLFRVVVREIEAWLMADREAIAHYLQVSASICSDHPETLPDAKQVLLNLVKKSKSREIKQDLLPENGSRASVGVGYNARLADFVWKHWDVNRALVRSNSLERAWKRICGLDQGK